MPSLYDKAAGVIMPRLGSNMPPPVTAREDADRVARLLERCPVAGLMLFNGDLDQTPAVLERMQQQRGGRLLVATDMERGVGQQVRGATVFPHAMAFSACGEEAESFVEATARAAAREARACGIHITFAPVADVNRNARNPIIATRAFSDDAGQAARLASAYVQGCAAEGLLTTAKHFPGHGSTSEDSHAETPVVRSDEAELWRTDLVPFQAAIGAGVDLVMTAHIAYPALDPTETPATLSRPILRDLLRTRMGFEGVVVSDSLLMGGIQATHTSAAAQAVAMLNAGTDLLLDVQAPEAVAHGIAEAVERGDLDEALLDAALARIEALRHRAFGTAPMPMSASDWQQHSDLARRVARAAVRIDAGRDAVPLADAASGAGVMIILVKPSRSRLDLPEEPLGDLARACWPEASYHQVGLGLDDTEAERLLHRAAAMRHVVLALVVKPAAWHTFGLQPVQQRFAERLVRQQPTVVASLGSPTILSDFSGAHARLCTFSDVAPSQRALIDVLAGK